MYVKTNNELTLRVATYFLGKVYSEIRNPLNGRWVALTSSSLSLLEIRNPLKSSVLEEALNGTVTIQPIALGQPIVKKVEKQCAHFYSVTITEKEAQAGLVCRVQSSDKSKFKEDSAKTGKVTSAGMYFLGFPVYRLDKPSNSVLAQFTEMTSRYAHEMQEIDDLLKQRNEIHASYTTAPPVKRSSSGGSGGRKSRSRSASKEAKEDGHQKPSSKERVKKKWFNIHVKVDKRKPC
ncbi:hypothetical protein Tco_1344555 [Tanacetum coccineum]